MSLKVRRNLCAWPDKLTCSALSPPPPRVRHDRTIYVHNQVFEYYLFKSSLSLFQSEHEHDLYYIQAFLRMYGSLTSATSLAFVSPKRSTQEALDESGDQGGE